MKHGCGSKVAVRRTWPPATVDISIGGGTSQGEQAADIGQQFAETVCGITRLQYSLKRETGGFPQQDDKAYLPNSYFRTCLAVYWIPHFQSLAGKALLLASS